MKIKFGAGLNPAKLTKKVSPARLAGEKFMDMKGRHGVGGGLLSKAAGEVKKRNKKNKKAAGK